MNREQYLRELEGRLSNRMPADQLFGVIKYYEEYFAEMGDEGEAQAIADLGTPAELSARIMGDRGSDPPARRAPPQEPPPEDSPRHENPPPHWDRPRRGLGAVWTVLLAILAAPIAIPLAIGLVALAVGLLIAIFAVFVGLGIGGLGAAAFGVFSAVVGFASMLTHGLSTTMYFVGGGMLTAGLGILLMAGAVALTGACLRGVAGLLGRLLRRGTHA